MTRPSFGTIGLAFGAALVLSPATRADAVPLEGDTVNGETVWRTQCAACHGITAQGDGPLAASLKPRPVALREGGWLVSLPEKQLLAAMTGGVPAEKTGGMPIHARELSELDARDLLTWLRGPVPAIEDFFPAVSEYIAHPQPLDEFGVERAESALGRKLTADEKKLLLVTAFKPAADGKPRPPGARPTKIVEEPAPLYAAVPKRKLGFVAYVPLHLDGGTLHAAVALDRGMRLVGVATIPEGDAKTEALRKRHAALLESFVGSGGRLEKKPIAPQGRGQKAPKDVQREMLKAYTIVLEAAAMYEKEEKDRFWADPEAFKQEISDMPDNVEFEFKQKKAK